MEIILKHKKISLSEALKEAKAGDVIYLEDKIYNEKITITTPNITLIGTENSKIVFSATSQDFIPEALGGDGKKTFGTTGSATVLVKPEATGFKAIGITFENNFRRDGRIQAQAVAFKSETSHIFLKNCTFMSHQDTLYLDYGIDNRLENSTIFGDVDFIFGSADCIFKNCKIHALGDEKNSAYYTAPSTYQENLQGFVFEHCSFSLDNGMEVYLGRPWYPSGALKHIQPRISFINCAIPKEVHLCLKQMHEEDPTNYTLYLEKNYIT
ncbi:MAG: pectinesterase family protein [Roseburia sp.]|nr:pectinesterase family protein [Anaeroplasma bactoclasticum]MCM1196983.1 pectinesterase family protein [Roseburia sp.]MCM1556526.1 pectinesterase family protein [Anaeroplasma bactoclasticum]